MQRRVPSVSSHEKPAQQEMDEQSSSSPAHGLEPGVGVGTGVPVGVGVTSGVSVGVGVGGGRHRLPSSSVS